MPPTRPGADPEPDPEQRRERHGDRPERAGLDEEGDPHVARASQGAEGSAHQRIEGYDEPADGDRGGIRRAGGECRLLTPLRAAARRLSHGAAPG
jgi:hypothetical protein